MLKLNKKIEYGIIVLGYFHRRRGEFIAAKDLVKEFHMSYEFCSKILQALTRGDVLSSKQGVQGGYILNKDLSKVSVYELQSILLGERYIADCLFKDKDCELESKCSIALPIKKLNNEINDFFKGKSVESFLSFNEVEKTKV